MSFDLLSALARFAAARGIVLTAGSTLSEFTEHVSATLTLATGNPIVLHGFRAENMFEALVVSLGEYKLLKQEDAGELHAADRLRAPDFRLVLRDGEHWLVEVKNARPTGNGLGKRRLLRRPYLEALNNYASATGAKLKLAIYWSRWSIWTLVSPEQFVDENGDVTLDMLTAIPSNEMARLGDRMIGARPPLRLRLNADPSRTTPIASDGKVHITFGQPQAFCGDAELIDPTDREIAWMFMRHGEWVESEPEVIVEGDRLIAIEFTWAPRERLNEGFEIVGTLSQMFASYFAEHTFDNEKVVQLRAPPRPRWFSPLIDSAYKSPALPLWRLVLQPAKLGHQARCAAGDE